MDPVTAALLDVRSFVAEEPAREGAGLHFAVSQVRILDYIDSILAALPDDGREGLDYDLTDAEEERLAEQLRRMDFMNWTARENAARLAGTVRAIFAARLRASLTDKP